MSPPSVYQHYICIPFFKRFLKKPSAAQAVARPETAAGPGKLRRLLPLIFFLLTLAPPQLAAARENEPGPAEKFEIEAVQSTAGGIKPDTLRPFGLFVAFWAVAGAFFLFRQFRKAGSSLGPGQDDSPEAVIAAVGPPPVLCESGPAWRPEPTAVFESASGEAEREGRAKSLPDDRRSALAGHTDHLKTVFLRIGLNLRPRPETGSPEKKAAPESASLALEAGTRPQPGRDDPESAGRRTKARALRSKGQRLSGEGKFDEALEAFNEALDIIQPTAENRPADLAWQRDLLVGRHNQSRTLERLGRMDEALSGFQQALELAQTLSERNPDNFDLLRGLASSHSHVGRLMLSLGRCPEARNHYENDLSIMLHLLKKQPDNRAWQHVLANSHHNLAQVREKSGQTEEAVTQYRQELALLGKLLKQEPDNSGLIMELASIRSRLAVLLKEQGRPGAALTQARAYLKEARKLNKLDSENRLWRRELTLALGQLGRLLEIRGDFDQALSNFEAAAVIRQNLAELAPEDLRARCELAISLYKVGDVHLAKNQPELALANYQEALGLIEKLIETREVQEGWLAEKCALLIRLGNLNKNQDKNKASEYYNRALAITEARAGSGAKDGWARLTTIIYNNMTA